MYFCPICNREIVGKVRTEVEEGVLFHLHCLLHFKDEHGFLWLKELRRFLK